MKNPIEYARRAAADVVFAAYEKAARSGELPHAEVRSPAVETPKDVRNGDFSSSFAMQNAKFFRMPPRATAFRLFQFTPVV